MKYLILFLILCFPLSAKDFWVYIATYDKPELSINEGGRSKKGDIVDITDADICVPTPREKEVYKILKVSDISKVDKISYLSKYYDDILTDKPIGNRKKRFDFKVLNLTETPGIHKDTFNANHLKNSMEDKTDVDILLYNSLSIAYNIYKPIGDAIDKIFLPTAYAAETVSTIKASGGNYTTFALWEDDKDGDITAGNAEVAELYYSYSGNCVFSGSITDVDSYFEIRPASGYGHDGTAASGVKLTGNVDILDDYDFVSDLIINGTIRFGYYQRTYGHVRRCVLYNSASVVNNGSASAGTICHVYNNVIYYTGSSNYSDFCVLDDTDSTAYFYNNTVDGNGYNNCVKADGTFYAKNNVVFDSGGSRWCYTGTFNAASTNNCADDTSTPEFNTYWDNVEPTFANKAGADYHLDSGDTVAKDNGTDLSGEDAQYTNDIDNVARTGTWDLGADQYVSAVTSVRSEVIGTGIGSGIGRGIR